VRETRHQFREDLEELERQALDGLEMVTGALGRALEAIIDHDLELAAIVVAQRMGALTRTLASDAHTALKTRHVSLARELACRHLEFGRLNRAIFNRAVEIGDELELREWAAFMILAARAIERIADNAAGIAEQTVFIVTGLFLHSNQPGASC
jgi:phosphate uptake regulator